MTIRAKFKCIKVDAIEGQEQILLEAVMGPENEPWSKYTPCGRLDITITNPAALAQFVPGRVYFLDISAPMATDASHDT